MTAYLIGWIGTALYLANHAAYSLSSRYPRPWYYGSNFVAAIGVACSSLMLASVQPVVINAFWALISILALLRFEKFPGVLKVRYFNAVAILLAIAALCFAPFNLYSAANILGWTSAFVFCGSYLLLASKRLSARIFQRNNMISALIILPNLYIDANWPTFLLEVCWAVLSAIAWLMNTRKASPI